MSARAIPWIMATVAPEAAVLPRRHRAWPWMVLSAVLLAALLVVLYMYTVPVRTVHLSGMDRYAFTSTNPSYWFNDSAFDPSPARCVGTSSYLCTDVWVAFNWSTANGHDLSFQFYGTYTRSSNLSQNVWLLYDAENTSFGGYAFNCGAEPTYCGEPFYIVTNDPLGQAWTVQWVIFYTYPATVPEL